MPSKLAGKVVEALLAIVASNVGVNLSFFGKAVGFVIKYTQALIFLAAGHIWGVVDTTSEKPKKIIDQLLFMTHLGHEIFTPYSSSSSSIAGTPILNMADHDTCWLQKLRVFAEL